MRFACAIYQNTPVLIWLALLFFSRAGIAIAQTNIGSAVEVEHDVFGTVSGRTRSIGTGAGVFTNDSIRTGRASSAALRFLDQSNLALGPSASILLDQFIFNPDQTTREAKIKIDIGAARWTSGSSLSRAYQFRTPHAVINVRGTAFDLLVETRRTIVTLRQGSVIVCLITAPQRCTTLGTPGYLVIATAAEIRGPIPTAPTPIQFADSCLRAITRASGSCAEDAFPESIPPMTARSAPQVRDPWKGFYIGGNIGLSWGSLDTSATVGPFSQAAPFALNFPGVSSSIQSGPKGLLGGVQLGYNWRIQSNWLAGIETDFQFSGQKTSTTRRISGVVGLDCTAGACFVNTTDITARLSWFGTIRGRTGIEQRGQWWYATGGLAYGKVKVSGTNTLAVTDTISTVVYSTPFEYSKTKLGWTIGIGTEGRLATNNWTWKIEYLHVDLGSIGGGSFGGTPVVAVNSTKFTDEIIRIGINCPLSN